MVGFPAEASDLLLAGLGVDHEARAPRDTIPVGVVGVVPRRDGLLGNCFQQAQAGDDLRHAGREVGDRGAARQPGRDREAVARRLQLERGAVGERTRRGRVVDRGLGLGAHRAGGGEGLQLRAEVAVGQRASERVVAAVADLHDQGRGRSALLGRGAAAIVDMAVDAAVLVVQRTLEPDGAGEPRVAGLGVLAAVEEGVEEAAPVEEVVVGAKLDVQRLAEVGRPVGHPVVDHERAVVVQDVVGDDLILRVAVRDRGRGPRDHLARHDHAAGADIGRGGVAAGELGRGAVAIDVHARGADLVPVGIGVIDVLADHGRVALEDADELLELDLDPVAHAQHAVAAGARVARDRAAPLLALLGHRVVRLHHGLEDGVVVEEGPEPVGVERAALRRAEHRILGLVEDRDLVVALGDPVVDLEAEGPLLEVARGEGVEDVLGLVP